jgi:type II secretory pathway pseudopilin PulG
MVEIALSLAIIGFALVAIIGVLPAGLNVQRNNREETIINQESVYFMDALRNGARGLDELTNRVVSITNFWTTYNTNGIPWSFDAAGTDWYTNDNSRVTSTNTVATGGFNLIDGYRIISLLSRPKLETINTTPFIIRSNHVVAIVRAIAGAATEKPPQTNVSVLDLGFSYRLLVEIHDVPQASLVSGQEQSVHTNLHEVRLRFRWPMLPGGRIGNGSQTFRSMAGGQYQTWIETNNHRIYYFNPSVY